MRGGERFGVRPFDAAKGGIRVWIASGEPFGVHAPRFHEDKLRGNDDSCLVRGGVLEVESEPVIEGEPY